MIVDALRDLWRRGVRRVWLRPDLFEQADMELRQKNPHAPWCEPPYKLMVYGMEVFKRERA